jgi:ABC-type metal ion transport system, periplasmic component/surface adhesin
MSKTVLIGGILLVILLFSITSTAVVEGDKELVVIVTFSYLKPDVERLICNGEVYALVPGGVDPHEYQLKPSDVDLLKKADLIISTGHTSFEKRVSELVSSGEVNSRLVDILEIPGLKFSKNPVTSQINYHMPLNDPVNYLVFMNYLLRMFIEIDREHLDCYLAKYFSIINELNINILKYRDSMYGKIIVDKPHAQYFAEWLGFHVAWIVKPEEEYQVSPSDLKKLQDFVRSGDIRSVFVTRPGNTPESMMLLELARDYSIPVIWVNNPSDVNGVYNSLMDLVSQFEVWTRSTTLMETTSTSSLLSYSQTSNSIISLVISFMIGVLVGYVINAASRRRR